MKIYVISGGPSAGKTSVINELGKKFKILREAARYVGDNDLRFKGKSVKGIERTEFQKAIFEFQKKQILELDNDNKTVFSDRGFGDTIAYYLFDNLEVPEDLLEKARKFRYAGIFFLEPLNFYVKDKLRQESKEQMKKIRECILKAYSDLSYNIIKVPFMPIEERIKFILEKVQKNLKI